MLAPSFNKWINSKQAVKKWEANNFLMFNKNIKSPRKSLLVWSQKHFSNQTLFLRYYFLLLTSVPWLLLCKKCLSMTTEENLQKPNKIQASCVPSVFKDHKDILLQQQLVVNSTFSVSRTKHCKVIILNIACQCCTQPFFSSWRYPVVRLKCPENNSRCG